MALDVNNFQRIGSISNAHAGKQFEVAALTFFARSGVALTSGFCVPIGFKRKKMKKFDLGSASPAVLVECKSHNWTQGENTPSAKIAVWNESMLYFLIAPAEYRKIHFVLHSVRRNESLSKYYIRNCGHLIPPGVEIWEYDVSREAAGCVYDSRTTVRTSGSLA